MDWWEINAAWGQTALLLTALARKIGLQFTKYKIVPFGNHSYVQVRPVETWRGLGTGRLPNERMMDLIIQIY